MTVFERDTAVMRVGPNEFTGQVSRRWWIARGPNGGYLAALLVRAVEATLDDPSRTARSLTVHYLEAPVEGEVGITTSIVRAGRSLTTVTATMTQDGRPMALALAAFSTPRPGPEFIDLSMPAVAAPDDVQPSALLEGMPPMLASLDLRQVIGAPPFSRAAEAVSGGWMRLAEPSIPDAAVVAFLTDAWVPAAFSRLDPGVGVPTVSLTIYFRRSLPRPDARADDFHLGVFRSRIAAEGFIEEDGEIWAPDGTLVAQSRQLAVLLAG
jgi:acyl-CoA thioesterase